ncbi:hypothetical protein [Novosphingobium sp. HII-3]|uniref:hypothetical protein n=1 Tax=Novosphingobium sp. HII-3 TaxID=2075565 RepID=UPI000CDB64AD|nr:hypothetical protein [Novosphingobium sp. HII-3]
MKIELKNLKLAPSLSEETTAYTATIHIDGCAAFHARNHGHGGGDDFDPVRDYASPDLQAVNAWLAVNEPPSGPFEPDPAKRAPYDTGSKCDLEIFVARLIDRHVAARQLRRLLKASVLRIGDDQQVYKLRMKPTEAGLAAVRATHPDWTIVNGASAEIVERASAILGGATDTEESVYARQREKRLTLEDARWLRHRNAQAERPCSDLEQFLHDFVAREEGRLERYRAKRQSGSGDITLSVD